MSDISVLIIEDRPDLLTRLAGTIAEAEGLRVAGRASTLAQGLRLLEELRPRILLVDLGLPDGSGLDAIAAAGVADWEIDSLVISVFGDEGRVVEAIRAGARGYILKGGRLGDVAEAIYAVLEGGSPISPAIARHLLGIVQREVPASGGAGEGAKGVLTEREIEILQAVARGYRRREIAERLEISPGTVGNHINNIYKKLGVGSNTQALSRAARLGIL